MNDDMVRKEMLDEDEAAREKAAGIIRASGGELKVPLHKIRFYASYMQGMREAYMRLFPRLIATAKKAERPYLEAEYRLLSSCIGACYDYHQGNYEIHYRNHVHDKRGRVTRCDAYFVRKASVDIEVRYGK